MQIERRPHLSADQLGNILTLFSVDEERCFLELIDALLDRHLVANRLLHVDQLKEALDPGHLLALVGWNFLDKFDGHLVLPCKEM